LKFRFPLSFPRRAEDTILPGVLSGLLVITFGFQLVLAGADPELPPVLAVGSSRGNVTVPSAAPVRAAQGIFKKPLFAPRQSMTAGQTADAVAPMGGASVAGTVTIRGRAVAVIRRPNGTVTNLSVGGTIDGWRLVSLQTDRAVFTKKGMKRDIAYGTSPAPVTDEDAAAEE
jgi:hypothetical protein